MVRGIVSFWLVVVLIALCAAQGAGTAQDGVSTAGDAHTRALGNAGKFPSPAEVVVEDIINYHRHELPRPPANQAVAMDVRWGNPMISGGEAVLQIGLATEQLNDRSALKPINLALVIDVSGSMEKAGKLDSVKRALSTLIRKLRPTDNVSIVVFNHDSLVAMAAQELGKPDEVLRLIQSLQPFSGTNIHAGLMAGYREASKHFDKNSTNRVILLTDGHANAGVTDPEAIARDSKEYNDAGIDLSTVGVGLDYNRELLATLARAGSGLFHFVEDAADIAKVFDKELQSLLSPVANNVSLEVEYPSSLVLDKIFGYAPKRTTNKVTIPLVTLNSGATQVVLMRFKLEGTAKHAVKVRLKYDDIVRRKPIELTADTTVTGTPVDADMLEDETVAKNYTIAILAQAMFDMTTACKAQQFEEALRLVNTALKFANERYPYMEDPDVRRVVDMVIKFRDLLRAIDGIEASIIPNGDFRQGNTGFTSDRPYIKPSPNCLWGGNYTISGSFNSPFRLHTNVPDVPFAPPKGGNAMYMNTGGTGMFTVWSAKITCKPSTRYRISFMEIGLSGGLEWRNSYEIQINGDRSEPQLGGDFVYTEIKRDWDSGTAKTATISIVRLPNAHGGGVIGVGNIEMVAVKAE